MSKELNIVFLIFNPIMSAFFAAGFYLLWRTQKKSRFIAVLVFSYLMRALCFLILYVSLKYSDMVLRQISNAMILITTALLVIAYAQRSHQAPRFKLLAFIFTVTMAGLQYFMSMDSGLQERGVVINLGLFAIFLVFLGHIRKAGDENPVAQFLGIQVVIAGAMTLARPLIILGSAFFEMDYPDFYWIFTSVSDAIVSVALAVGIFAVMASDVMEKIKAEALTDSLSGLLNRRGFEKRADAVLFGETSDRPAAMVMCDLDHFKKINDSFGHLAGDRVIRAFSDKLRENAPPRTLIGRLGGEEFAVFLMADNSLSARKYAQDVQTSFNAISAGLVNGEMHPTASFGIAYANEGDGLFHLLDRSDRALYQAKKQGRNCICEAEADSGQAGVPALPELWPA